jgi:hypothetical protein
MCNDRRPKLALAAIFESFADLNIKIRFGEGAPNIGPRDDITITDTAPIVRTVEGGIGEGEIVQRR